MSTAGVDLRFRDKVAQVDVGVRRSWPGYSVECIRINEQRIFDYDWQGPSHYLAVHDILLRDGEVIIGDDIKTHRTDLRDLLTFVPQNARVSGWSDLASGGNGYTAIFFDPDLAEAEYERPFLGHEIRPLAYFENAQLCQTLRRIEHIVTSGEEIEPVAAETLGLLAVLQFYPNVGGIFRNSAGQLTLLQQSKIAEFIKHRISSSISLSEMAAVAELSRYHFARSFARTYGRPPHQYLLLRRISLAATLLAKSNLPVSEIAIRVGFSSPARLSIAFHRIVGRTPRAFRQDSR
jgi:AraC family transcriptional regulator